MSLPFYRRERRRESREAKLNGADSGRTQSTTSLPTMREAVDFVWYWIRVSWKDILAMAVFGGTALAVSVLFPSHPTPHLPLFPPQFTNATSRISIGLQSAPRRDPQLSCNFQLLR